MPWPRSLRLLERARALGTSEPEHYVFPACEERIIDPSRPQKSWRTAWRKLVRETARRVGREVARHALESGKGVRGAITAWKRAAAPIRGLRSHDLRYQAITEMAEAGASDATLMAVAGHIVASHARTLQPCTHGREPHGAGKTGKRFDGRALGNESTRNEQSELSPYVTTTPSNSSLCLYLLEMNGGRDRTRTCDLLRVKQAL